MTVSDWLLNQTLTYGPGLLLVALLYAAHRAIGTLTRHIRRTRPWTIHDLEGLANNPANPRYTRQPARKETP